MFPSDSVGYCRNETLHVRDSDGKHWTAGIHWKSGHPYIRTIPKKAAKLYGRPSGSTSYSDALKSISHGLMNIVSQEGSWAWYTGYGGKKNPQSQAVGHKYIPARNHTAIMTAATKDELTFSCNATVYARNGHGARFTKGHSAILYEWCHLVSHGLGGLDVENNIVAATKYQNTEQLILENVLYEYRMEGLSIRVQAKLASGTKHLAESVYYEVLLNGAKAYSRTMDGRRATNVTYDEYKSVAKVMRQAINNALGKAYPINGIDPEVLSHVEKNTDTEVIIPKLC